MKKTAGLLEQLKRDIENSGKSKGKIFFVKAGSNARIRFLSDADDYYLIQQHDRWEPTLNVLCFKNFDEDADCPYCNRKDEGIRTRQMYCWSIWDYEAKEVKLFMYPANQCSPVPNVAAVYQEYGTITDRDYKITRSGTGKDTSYTLFPLDKGKMRNEKAKPLSEKAILKLLKEAYPVDGDAATMAKDKDESEELPWEDDENKYEGMTPRELFNLCKERDLDVKSKKEKDYYIAALLKYDEANEDDEDSDFWDYRGRRYLCRKN